MFLSKNGDKSSIQSEMTTLLSLDTSEGDAASSLMFKIDELALEKHIDSIADQIIDFNSEECKLTKGLRP